MNYIQLPSLTMFSNVVPAIRRATGNRFTPAVSLILSAAAFVLTILVVAPGTNGDLESFHLLTVSGQRICKLLDGV
jgi:hypothetical protein